MNTNFVGLLEHACKILHSCRERYCFTNSVSVRLSVRHVVVLNARCQISLPFWCGITLVFEPDRVSKIPLSVGVKYTCVENFERNLSLSGKRYQISVWLLWITNRQVGAIPIRIPHPTNLALFGPKITLYRFNQGGRGSYYCRGSNRSRWAQPPLPLTLTTDQWFCDAGGSPDEATLEQTPYPFQPHKFGVI